MIALHGKVGDDTHRYRDRSSYSMARNNDCT